MHIEKVAIATLIEDPANARKHSDKNLQAIKGSLAKFGQQKPIVVGPNNVVIAEIDPHYCDVIVARWEKCTGVDWAKTTDFTVFITVSGA